MDVVFVLSPLPSFSKSIISNQEASYLPYTNY